MVEFKPRDAAEPEVWQCLCGSFAFWLYSDGSISCVQCETEAQEMQGLWRVPSAREDQMAQVLTVAFTAKGGSYAKKGRSMADPINAESIHLICKNEGCVLHTYTDSVGVLTCCYGHTGSEAVPGRVFTQAEAQALLAADLTKFEDGVDDLLAPDADTSENEFGAMVSLAYNIGLGNFSHSTVIGAHNAGNKAAAADAFLMWNKAGGAVLAGLDRRRHEERALYLKPDMAVPEPAELVTAPSRDDKPGLIAFIVEMLGRV